MRCDDFVSDGLRAHHRATRIAAPEDLCRRLQALPKPVECFTYAGQRHTFVGEGDRLFVQRVQGFFGRHLKQP